MAGDNEKLNDSCPACGSKIDSDELCTCGYDPSLELQEGTYVPQFALTATLDKVPGDAGPIFKESLGEVWTLDTDDVQLFIKQIEKKFKLKRKLHGVINKNSMSLSTPNSLKKYLNQDIEFKYFVQLIMDKMRSEANNDKSRLSGGAIVFIHYNVDNDKESCGRLFIIMVDRKGVFNFDKDLIPEKLPSIDIDSLRQAVLVDLTLFKASYPENNGEPYLHFISGRSSSEFFKRALGCNPKIDNNRSIDETNRAVDDFIKSMNLKHIDRVKVKQAVETLMKSKAKDPNDRKITVENIGRCIEKTLPENEGIKAKFVQFVDVNEYSIDDFFEPSRFSSNSFGEIKISDAEQEYECKISIDAISEDNSSNAKVIYDRVNGHLIIRLSRNGVTEIEKIVG
ncbi:nucleoid-associated protein [Salmonella enterica]|nr:nucleoid-associated protein [Salmonella enterica]EHU3755184.1 nucleoid-associated protein [Salmonella enterica]ELH6268184.1 nucleoid-associated protein [Salmonella enterica]ELU4341673.1 nucleoid-associated protein [Salmonella enterica]